MEFTHFDAEGNAVMVDVGGKKETEREAVACGTIHMSRECFEKVLEGQMSKGDVLGTARIAGIMGASIRNAVIAVALVSWTKYARLARSLVLKVRNQDYVAAAVVTGSKTSYILRKYMVPNVIPTLIITGATDIGGMMLEIAGLSFLGFGAKAPTPEWGLMLNEGRQFIQNASWMMVFPGAAIFTVVVVFNLLGDALRDVLDPKNE